MVLTAVIALACGLVLSGLDSAESSKQANAHWYMTQQQLQSVHAGCKAVAATLHVCCSIVVALTSCLFAHSTSRYALKSQGSKATPDLLPAPVLLHLTSSKPTHCCIQRQITAKFNRCFSVFTVVSDVLRLCQGSCCVLVGLVYNRGLSLRACQGGSKCTCLPGVCCWALPSWGSLH